jgi:hypothetical protein
MSGITKVTLDLDDGGNEFGSLVDAAIGDGVENEKCVVAQYRTTPQHKQAFSQLLRNNSREDVPIEWVIDIADESNGWFYATAYSFDDVNQTLYVMVPDKVNPTFKGNVQLDHRTVHLIECVDQKSSALFNKIIRDSVIKIKWDVEWFEEAEDGQGEGSWIPSSARYYIRMANQLLVEDKVQGSAETRGFVIITADMNVKLVKCHKNRGIEDFNRLINEGIVSSAADALGSESPDAKPEGAESSSGVSTRKLAETARVLKECIADLVEERERKQRDEQDVATFFHRFTVDGDLDQGLKVMKHFERIQTRAAKKVDDKRDPTESEEEEEKMLSTAQDAKYLSGKIEKSLMKVLHAGGELSSSGGVDEVEQLRRNIKKLKRDLEDKERELRTVKGLR